jgi:multiple sugar transport system permease protein
VRFWGLELRRSESYFAAAVWFVPAAMLLVAVVVYPVFRTLGLSFVHENLANGFQSEFAGLDNFARIAVDTRLRSSLWTTLFFTVVSVGAEFFIGLLLALSMDALRKWRNLVRVVFLVPWTLPTAVIAVLWAWIFNDQFGVLNAILVRIGFINTPIAWLAQPGTAMSAIIAADVWKTTPFVFLILLAGLQNIPRDLYEAIEVDGGGAWAKFRHVTWPHLLPFVFVAMIFRIVQAFAIFDLVWVMTGGGPAGTTETISIYTYQTYMRYLDFGYGSALAVTTVIILGLTAAALYRLLVTRYERIL